MSSDSPVITIDGPAASGKGTLALHLSEELRFNLLDSGLLYRIVAFIALDAKLDLNHPHNLDAFIRNHVSFNINQASDQPSSRCDYKVYIDKTVGVEDIVWVNDQNVNSALRSNELGFHSSVVSAHEGVRQLLIPIQRAMRRPPGLIADGRDMGTVVFPDAEVKFFLDASIEVRARRRLEQLKHPVEPASLANMVQEIRKRDDRDRTREIAPLKAAPDALMIDTTARSIEDVVHEASVKIRERLAI